MDYCKKILILGANYMQLPLIKRAKEMGLYVYVASIPGEYPGFKIADKVFYIDTTDKNGIYEMCKNEHIDGICTTGTDVAVRSIGFVNSALGLNGISNESSILVTDKAKMKEVMAANGVNTAEFFVCYSFEDVRHAAEKIGYPVMVKTVDQAASKGISKVYKECDLEAAYANALSWTKKSYIVVERCLSGNEIGLDGFVDKNGECTIFLHNKLVFNNGQTDVPIGHSIPFKGENDIIRKTIEIAEKCVEAMKMRSVFFNMDLIIEGGKPYVLEIGGRSGSTGLPEMISAYCGFDYYEKMIQNALGYDVDMSYTPKTACAVGFLRSERRGGGKVVSVDFDKLNSFENASYKLDFSIGDTVKEFKFGSDSIGSVVCVSDNIDSVERYFSEFQRAFQNSIKYE